MVAPNSGQKFSEYTPITSVADDDLLLVDVEPIESDSVHTTTKANLFNGDQTVTGVKTFSSSPIVPDPTTSLQAANKEYVDAQVAGDVPVATFTTNGTVKQTVYNVRDYGAVGDGVTDDTTAINDTSSAANSNGGGLVLLSTGTYIVSANLQLYSNVFVYGPSSAIIKRANSVNTYIFQNNNVSTGNTELGIGGVTLDGNASNNSSPNMINLVNVSYSLFSNVTITNGGNGFRIVGGTYNKFIGNAGTNAANNHNFFNPQNGSNYNLFQSNTTDSYTVAINLDGTTNPSNYNVINDNVFSNNTTATAGDCILLANGCNYNTISNNVIYNFKEDGIRVTDSSTGNTVTGNTIGVIGRYGVSLATNNTSNTVTGNTITSANEGIFIDQTSNHNTVTGNTVYSSTNTGIYVNSTTFSNIITGNTLVGNGQYGVYLTSSQGNNVSSNFIDGVGTTSNGVYVLNSSNNNIGTNQVKNCTSSGMRIQETVSTSTADNNVIGNRVFDDQMSPTQVNGINEVNTSGTIDGNVYIGNDVNGNKTTNMSLAGGATTIAFGNKGAATDSNGYLPSTGGTLTGNLAFSNSGSRTITVNRNTVSNTAGISLAIQSGGATSGATNKAAGDLLIKGGISTGTGNSRIVFQAAAIGTTGTSDNSVGSVGAWNAVGLSVGTNLSPTASVHTAASTTSNASLRIPSGSAPSSPNSGDVWFDGTHLQFRNGSTTNQIDSQFAVAGAITDANNISFGTTTGTKIGTATTQKLAFYNATPIVQPTGDVVTALQNLGLIASATITPTTNANLTGPITSVGNATSIASQTGTGSTFVMSASPTMTGTTTTGNLTLGTAGNKISITTGSNASAGTGTLVGGTATISTSAVTASSLIFLTDTATSVTNVGSLTVSAKTAGTSFIVTSTLALDTSTFNWLLVN